MVTVVAALCQPEWVSAREVRGLGPGVGDVDPAGLRRGLDVAQGVGRPVDDRVLAGARDGERARVGLRAPPSTRVVDARRRPSRRRRWPRGSPSGWSCASRELVGCRPGRRDDRPLRVDLHGAATGRADVAGVVQWPGTHRCWCRRRSRLREPARRRRCRPPRVQVVAPSRRYCVPASPEPPVSAGFRRTVTALLCQRPSLSLLTVGAGGVDVHVAGLVVLDVAGGVDRPVDDGVLTGRRDRERGAVGLRQAAVDGVVGGARAGEPVGVGECHELGVLRQPEWPSACRPFCWVTGLVVSMLT